MSRSLILIVGMISVGLGQWTWDNYSTPMVVTKAVGDTVWLGPNLTDLPTSTTDRSYWSFKEMFIVSFVHPGGADRVHLHPNLTLEIRELELNDTGTYNLYAEYNSGWHGGHIYLHVLEEGHGGEPEGGHEGGHGGEPEGGHGGEPEGGHGGEPEGGHGGEPEGGHEGEPEGGHGGEPEGGHGGEPEGGHGGEPEGGLTSGAIAGIVCGLLFAVAVAVGLVLLAMFKLRRVWELPRLEDGMRLSELTPKAAL